MKMIAAVDRKWGIGYQNKLLVSIPEDMKNFRMITTGGIVVMGRKTLESFPGGIPLAERTNIILSKDKNYNEIYQDDNGESHSLDFKYRIDGSIIHFVDGLVGGDWFILEQTDKQLVLQSYKPHRYIMTMVRVY